ncbi:hypothetical protein [Bombilactobacillus thymidiniphilus]|uniref:WxL domain-containing protein n=1 Tax=Bombilactobacillus thymidiniphilus TaxID=2923363 RepID=A0ABY4PC23_9LACO|nr:hypothetical protein [Bombilactobacillus thymidiniphilus]UQS83213.1 hypothetical protein MOO47_05345 [Bombilactobacillus thymidiniphilus]
MNKSKWGIVLFAVFLMGGITAANDFESVCADDVTGTTDVSVTFTDAKLYIVSMPNLDFGTNKNYRKTSLNLANTNTEETGKDRYLQVNSPDTNVPFKVSVQNGTNYLVNPATGKKVDDDASDLISESDSESGLGTLSLSSDANSVSVSSTGNANDWTTESGVAGVSGDIPLGGQTPTDVFTSAAGFQGQVRVALNDKSSATLQLNPGTRRNLEAKLGSYGNTGLTLIMPLTWTISIDNTQSMGL